MNRLILKYKYPITFAILAVLAWVIYRYFSMGGSQLITFVVVAVLVWGLGTFVFLYFWPPITYSAYKRAVVRHGLGGDHCRFGDRDRSKPTQRVQRKADRDCCAFGAARLLNCDRMTGGGPS